MKKLVAILTLCLLCACCAFGFAACEEESGGNTPAPDTPTHTHEYMEIVITPTCTTDGYTMHVCTCKDWYKDNETAALGHNYEWTTTKEPTETEDGVKTGVCTRCGDTITQSIPASNHEHNYIITVVPASCTAGGYTAHKCACGNEYTDNETPALGHNYEWITTKQPTCTEKGEKTATCTRCHETKTEEINATGHKFTNYVSDGNATFESDGTKTAYCNYGCGAKDTIPDVGSKLAEIEEFFTKQQDGTYYGKVFNKTTTFNFTNKIKGGIEYYVCTDAACTKTLTNNIANLNVGDNVLYVLFADGNKTTATVRRRAICTVNFNSAGGTAVSSQNIEEDRRATAPKSPMRLGYTFNSWDYDFNEPITANTTITAIWNANTNTPYKVEYYLQNLEDDNYTLTETANLTGTTDTTATVIKTYEHFTVVETTASANIKPDGTTVLQVYYMRDVYSVNISASDNVSLSQTFNGQYKYGYIIPEITATYNTIYNSRLGYDEWHGWYSDNEFMTLDFTIPSFIVDKNIDYCAKGEKEEMSNFNFTSTATNCTITGIKDKTVKEIIVPDYVTEINYSVFNGCSSLESITIPFVGAKRGVSSYDKWQYPFGYIFGSSSYTGGTETKQNYYGGSTTSQGTYYIPTLLKSVTVTGGNILYGAFSNCSSLTSITMPDSVTSIGERAFMYCSSLTSITIPNSVKRIGNCAFYYCSSLTSITIPDSVTGIGEYAFNGCSSLQFDEYDNGYYLGNSNNPYVVLVKAKSTDIISCGIYNDTKFICNGAFSGCSALKSITIPFVGGSKYATSASSSTLFGYIFGTSSYTGGTATSQSYSSSNYSTTYYIPSSLRSVTITGGNILYGAFYKCSKLTSITIPDSITSIGEDTFYNCSGLTSVNYTGTIDKWCEISFYSFNSNPLYYAKNLYIDNELVTTANIKTATKINYYAFHGCSSLISITIGNSVTSIGEYAFGYCRSLTSITISDSVTSIGEYAFSGCSALKSITIPFVGGSKYATSASSSTLFGYIFGTSSNTGGTATEQYYSSSNYSTTYYIPSSLKSVTVTGGNILYGAFSNCSSLTSITIPDSVTSIGSRAFSNCSSLTSITIPDSVSGIGGLAFYECSGLTSITIPDTVTSIGYSAFYNCSSLTDIIFKGTKANWNAISKDNNWKNKVPSSCVVHCSDGDVNI